MLNHADTAHTRDHDELVRFLDSGKVNLELAGNRKQLRDLFRRMSFAGGYENQTLALLLPDAFGMADWFNTHRELQNLQELRRTTREAEQAKQVGVCQASKGIKKAGKSLAKVKDEKEEHQTVRRNAPRNVRD